MSETCRRSARCRQIDGNRLPSPAPACSQAAELASTVPRLDPTVAKVNHGCPKSQAQTSRHQPWSPRRPGDVADTGSSPDAAYDVDADADDQAHRGLARKVSASSRMPASLRAGDQHVVRPFQLEMVPRALAGMARQSRIANGNGATASGSPAEAGSAVRRSRQTAARRRDCRLRETHGRPRRPRPPSAVRRDPQEARIAVAGAFQQSAFVDCGIVQADVPVSVGPVSACPIAVDQKKLLAAASAACTDRPAKQHIEQTRKGPTGQAPA